MNIKDFFTSLSVSAAGIFPESVFTDFPNLVSPFSEDPTFPLLRVNASGAIHARTPFSVTFPPLGCFLLLYTLNGNGNLRAQKKIHPLPPSTLLLLDCQQQFSLNIADASWEYLVFFLTGGSLSYYKSLLPQSQMLLLSAPAHSEMALHLETLPSCCKNPSPFSALLISNQLDGILTRCIASQHCDAPAPTVPGYLFELKHLFDTAFEQKYTLEQLSYRFQINKYRLCREFRTAFGCSPIQYLNQRRIEIAKNLLLTSNCKVHEAGCRVGIENTSHFISLFKKYTGLTPMEYRQRQIF